MFPRVGTKSRHLPISPFYILSVFLLLLVVYLLFVLNRETEEDVGAVRILCFGDSLTVGLTASSKSYPYSSKLQDYFDSRAQTEDRMSKRATYKVSNAGISGQRAEDQMLPRLKNILQQTKARYNWVIILAGTNDLRKNSSMVVIFDSLVKLHSLAHQLGARTVAVTVPDRKCEFDGSCAGTKGTRVKVNEELRHFALSSSGKVILADLEKEIFLPRDQKLWSDAVHFTVEGYQKLANIVYNSMKKHV